MSIQAKIKWVLVSFFLLSPNSWFFFFLFLSPSFAKTPANRKLFEILKKKKKKSEREPQRERKKKLAGVLLFVEGGVGWGGGIALNSRANFLFLLLDLTYLTGGETLHSPHAPVFTPSAPLNPIKMQPINNQKKETLIKCSDSGSSWVDNGPDHRLICTDFNGILATHQLIDPSVWLIYLVASCCKWKAKEDGSLFWSGANWKPFQLRHRPRNESNSGWFHQLSGIIHNNRAEPANKWEQLHSQVVNNKEKKQMSDSGLMFNQVGSTNGGLLRSKGGGGKVSEGF